MSSQRAAAKMMPLISIIVALTYVSSSNNPTAARTTSTIAPPLPPIGLVNLGNTCYLNSQLQCAYSIPKVRDLLISSSTSSSISSSASSSDNTSDDDQQSSSRTILGDLFAEMRQVQQGQSPAGRQSSYTTGKGAVTPRTFCHTLGIPIYEQQDAQEFWKLLLPTLQFPNLIDLYKGEMEIYIKSLCSTGAGRDHDEERRRKETYLDLSLDIGNVQTVQEAIVQSYITPEQLLVSEGNGWRPRKGETPIDAEKGSTFIKSCLPSILQLHLKRFQYDYQSETMSKINRRISFPLSLRLPPVVRGGGVDTNSLTSSRNDDDRCEYLLQAVLIHAGEFESGHYYVYIRSHPQSDLWYRCNDDRIDTVTWDDVAQDAFGGKADQQQRQADDGDDDEPVTEQQQLSSSSISSEQQDQDRQRRDKAPILRLLCHLWRQWRFFGEDNNNNNNRSFLRPNDDKYGFGGRTSNAYVLQYVRRCQIDMLFGP